ncbi:MAG TPA: efflux RND transporter periplasmic adaptor subunit [Bryobacteraceae bacterium]|jgi:multidrug efflux pump subunit AcrA (membrane-fusion protein)|nr:efflux RND transporter periplasmic adaptor subunit [Bryobacteraceae bacterium]
MATTEEPLADVPDKPAPPSPGEGNRQTNTNRTDHKHSPVYWIVFALLLLAAAAAVFFIGWLPRHKQQQQIDAKAKEQSSALPRIDVVKVKPAPAESELLVPGTTQAFTEANVYARASGYIAKRSVDIGDRVHAGQLLAIIDAPDLDKQVAQARSSLRQSESSLAQMEAQQHLASLTWDRYRVLVAKGVFSRQDGDNQEANFRVSEANVNAAKSTVQANRDNLERLTVLQGYERVTSPFGGTVTARNVDVGTLITAQGTGVPSSSATLPGTTQAGAEGNNAGSAGSVSSTTMPATGGSAGGAMFTIADTNVFRVLVSVPEAYSSIVRMGQDATLLFQEVPGETFHGRVTRTSASIDQNTRTLLVEVQVRNHRGLLMPGMYAQVNLIQSKEVPPLLVQGEAIVVRNGQNEVAVVKNQKIHFQPVSIGRDYGDQAEITNGLRPGDVVALDVSDDVREGVKIQPEFSKEKLPRPGVQNTQKSGAEGQYGNQGLSNQGQKNSSGQSKPPSRGSSGKQAGSQTGSQTH